MAPCYVVFEGNTPGIYFTWHKCSIQVLGYKNARYKKHQNYEQTLHDYNASLQAASPSQIALPSNCFAAAVPPIDERLGDWKNVVIVALFLLVVALWMRLTLSG
jgi:hypothetical protein